MADTEVDLLTLRAAYVSKVDADLELIAKECHRINSDIAALQDQLRVLEGNQALLTGMREVLAEQAALQERDGKPGETAAPMPSDGMSLGPGRASTRRAPEVRTKIAARRTSTATGKQPTLRELLIDELLRRGEPCSSQDVTSALSRAHPHRRIKEPAMRNALEALVAQNRAKRIKRGTRVFYCADSTSAYGSAGAAAS